MDRIFKYVDSKCLSSFQQQFNVKFISRLEYQTGNLASMEIAGLVASAIGCCAYLVRQRSHVASLKEKLITLGDKLEELSCRESDVRAELDIAGVIRGKKPKSEVQLWLDEIERMEAEVEKIEARTSVELGSCMPNWFVRLKLSKKIARKIKQVEEFMKNGRFSEGLLLEMSVGHGKILSVAALFGKTTALKNLSMIWDALNDAGTGKMGVYGMGGSGKTTILMHVNNQIVRNHAFNQVIWVTVSRIPNLMKLQHEIAKALNLDLFMDDEDETSRAAKLLHIFMQWRNFVLILDDLWVAYPLHRIGIPEPDRANGLKLVLTTRSLEVCRGMEVEKVIKINLLSREEAWDLFRDKVGHQVVLDPEVENVARLVMDECGRLPLGLVTVGGGMREVTDIRAWRNSLYELKNSAAKNKGMETNVFECLRFSYNHLADETVRECFMYCALYPNGQRILSWELVGCWIAEGLVWDEYDVEAAKDKCYVIISELQNACLLEAETNESGEEFVKMHDLVRDMAIDISRINHSFAVHAGVGLKKAPAAEQWDEGLRRVSLMNNKIETLVGQPRCPKLSTLFIQGNTLLQNVANSFFGHMLQLKVLDMSNTRIESLPESVSFLTKLQSLVLQDCVKLRYLPSFENLLYLRVLNLDNTAIQFLPMGLNRLSKLRSLDLSRTAQLRHIDRETILALTSLEDLSTYGSRWKWAIRSESGGATVAELAFSESLINLNVQFLDFEASGYYVQSGRWKSLQNFNFLIGWSKMPSLIHAPPKKQTVYVGGHTMTSLMGNPFPDSTLDLSINDSHDIADLSQLMLMNLHQLKECSVSRCKRMEYILGEKPGCNLPQNLSMLWLWELPKLRGISKRTVPRGAFANLKWLTIYDCDSLTRLFSSEMSAQLQSLEVIDICSCISMEEVFSTDEGSNPVALPNLKRISLDFLPCLTWITRGSLICPSLRYLVIDFCPTLRRLPFSAASLPTNLEYIHGSRAWWDALKWDEEVTKRFLNKHCSLRC